MWRSFSLSLFPPPSLSLTTLRCKNPLVAAAVCERRPTERLRVQMRLRSLSVSHSHTCVCVNPPPSFAVEYYFAPFAKESSPSFLEFWLLLINVPAPLSGSGLLAGLCLLLCMYAYMCKRKVKSRLRWPSRDLEVWSCSSFVLVFTESSGVLLQEGSRTTFTAATTIAATYGTYVRTTRVAPWCFGRNFSVGFFSLSAFAVSTARTLSVMFS